MLPNPLSLNAKLSDRERRIPAATHSAAQKLRIMPYTEPIKAFLVHLGYARALSTWLQKHLWSNHAAGFSAPAWTPELLQQMREDLVLIHPLSFDADAFRGRWAPRFHEARALDLVPVLTMERLSGSPVTGSYDCKDIAERLNAAFPEARILICVREQVSMLFSQYHRYVAAGGTKRFEMYASPGNKDPRFPTFNFQTFEYDLLVKLYMDLFGDERVLVCPLEMFKQDPARYLERFFAFSGLPYFGGLPTGRAESLNHPTSTLPLKRFLNQIIYTSGGFQQRRFTTKLRRLRNMPDRRVPQWLERRARSKLGHAVDGIVGNRYAESNRRLATRTGLDLASLGYPT